MAVVALIRVVRDVDDTTHDPCRVVPVALWTVWWATGVILPSPVVRMGLTVSVMVLLPVVRMVCMVSVAREFWEEWNNVEGSACRMELPPVPRVVRSTSPVFPTLL